MKTIAIAGNIGKDAVVRTTQQGDKVASWSVAVEERAGQDKRTIWFDCSLWGKRGDALAQYLTKGSRVAVSGEISTREHEGKTYLTIRVAEVTLQGGSQAGARTSGEGNEHRDYGGSAGPDMEDEIAFAPEMR